MVFLLYLVVYCLKSCHIHYVTRSCWCISIGVCSPTGPEEWELLWSLDGQWHHSHGDVISEQQEVKVSLQHAAKKKKKRKKLKENLNKKAFEKRRVTLVVAAQSKHRFLKSYREIFWESVELFLYIWATACFIFPLSGCRKPLQHFHRKGSLFPYIYAFKWLFVLYFSSCMNYSIQSHWSYIYIIMSNSSHWICFMRLWSHICLPSFPPYIYVCLFHIRKWLLS